MLQIRLSKGSSSDGGGSVKPLPVDTVTVACPDHLVLADLPVAKSIGAATSSSLVKTVGRRSRRQLGERVHFCVRCDFPIAIYGRLSPCEHVFCLDCARSDSICYLCDERIQKIQTIKIMEGIFICAAPHCLKSFLKRTDFESHIHTSHTDLLQSNAEKEDGKESEVQSSNQPTGSDSTVRGPPRPIISPGSNPQLHDTEDKARWQQPREQLPPRPMMPKGQPAFGQVQNYPSEPQLDSNQPPGFDRTGPHHYFQQGFDRQGTPQPESSQFSDRSQGHLSENQFSEYPPMHSMQQPPNFAMPMNSNPMITSYGVPPFPTDGTQPFYGAPYEMGRPSPAPGAGSEQGSFMNFPPGPVGGVNYPAAAYPQPWNGGQTGVRFEATPGSHMMPDGFANYQGDYGRNPGGLPTIPPQQSANKGMEAVQGSNAIDPRDGVDMLASQPMQVQPLPRLHHMSQHKRGKFHPGDMGRDGQGFGWQQENRDGFAGSQD